MIEMCIPVDMTIQELEVALGYHINVHSIKPVDDDYQIIYFTYGRRII